MKVSSMKSSCISPVIIILVLTFPAILSAECTLVKKGDFRMRFGSDLAVHCIGSYREDNFGFVIDAAKIKLIGEYAKRLKLYLSLDPSKPNSSSKDYYTEPLDKVYLQYAASKKFKIRIGQFKNPFGNEMQYGIQSRPQLYHRITTKKICPDLDRGIMLSGKKVFGFFGYAIGLFNGTSVEQSLSTASGQVPAKLFFQKKVKKRMNLMFGYNALYRGEIPYSNQWEHRFADGYFIDMKYRPHESIHFHLLTEYLERLDFRHFGASTRNWERGGFVITALRIQRIEPVLYWEIYDHESLFSDDDDIIQYGIGLNTYFFNDNFRFRIDSQFEHKYYTGSFNCIVTVGVQGHI